MASRSIRSRRAPPTLHSEQPSRAKWTAPLTKILVDLMVDQVQKGNKQKNSFGKKAWKIMCDEFDRKTGLKWDKEQLKNRFNVLRKQYGIIKSLLDQSDFKWDEATGAIMAKDEVWNRYIMEHPDTETVKSSGCPIYKELCTIFSEPVMNGEHNRSNEYKERTLDVILCPEPLSTFLDEPSSEESEEEANMEGNRKLIPAGGAISPESPGYCRLTPTILPSTGGRKRGRRGIDSIIANAILEMAAASKLTADAIEQYNNRFSITDCVRALDDLEGVDEQVYHAALELFNNSNARETFLSLKLDKRLMWLYSKCAALSSS